MTLNDFSIRSLCLAMSLALAGCGGGSDSASEPVGEVVSGGSDSTTEETTEEETTEEETTEEETEEEETTPTSPQITLDVSQLNINANESAQFSVSDR